VGGWMWTGVAQPRGVPFVRACGLPIGRAAMSSFPVCRCSEWHTERRVVGPGFTGGGDDSDRCRPHFFPTEIFLREGPRFMNAQKYTMILLTPARVAAVTAQLIHLRKAFEFVPVGERSRVGVKVDDADTLVRIVENLQSVEAHSA
jgi:hypothetical protein